MAPLVFQQCKYVLIFLKLTAGCGLVNGPFGKANMLTTAKKNATAQTPYHTFRSSALSSLEIIQKKFFL